MLLNIAVFIAIGCIESHFVDALSCYSCTNSTSLPDCKTILQCPTDSICFSEYETINGNRLYTLGCRNVLSCPIIPTVSSSGTSSIIGRRAVEVNTNCSECCQSSYCNRQLCQDADQYCADDKNYSCENVGSVIDICVADSHFKSYCKRFCGFCNTVDGGWSHWSEWDNCDVTCGNGTRTKSRTCSDPPPANGGSDCVGAKEAHESCSKGLCPVNGGWSQWSPWGLCSVTCDVGLQRRDRYCSNPYPALYGDHCYGDSRADRLCFPGACANGSWSSWSSWGHCTRTCNGGVKIRTRDCDNPAPSMTGLGCSGEATEADSCNISPCQGPVVFFARDLPGGQGTIFNSHSVLKFINVITNVGHGYDSSTGFFTAPVNGTYSFNIQICAYTNNFFGAGLFVNNAFVTNLRTYGDDGDTCRSLSVPVILKQGDKVQVKTDSGSSKIAQIKDRVNAFSGTLIQLQN